MYREHSGDLKLKTLTSRLLTHATKVFCAFYIILSFTSCEPGLQGAASGVGTNTDITENVNARVNPPQVSCLEAMDDPMNIRVPAAANSWDPQWTYTIQNSLQSYPHRRLIEQGAFSQAYMDTLNCPQFHRNMNDSQRAAVVTTFMSELARVESNFNPRTNYTETFGTISRGLFQMAPETVNMPAYNCQISDEGIYDGNQNARCAILVLNQNLRSSCGGRFPCDTGIYFGPLKTVDGQPKSTYRQIETNTRSMIASQHPYCQASYWSQQNHRLGQAQRQGVCRQNNNINRGSNERIAALNQTDGPVSGVISTQVSDRQ